MTAHSAVAGVEINAKPSGRQDEILSAEALAFVAGLHRRFNRRRLELLARRMERQKDFDAGKLPDFLPDTKSIREGDWTVAKIPPDLLDRRVEITGPVDRKMIVNALNSGAKVFMADFEDATSPVFANMVEGQANLKDRWAGKIDFTDPTSGKAYALKNETAVLMVRPRGWHLPERHVVVDGEAMSGSLFDFGLYVFHSAKAQIAQGATPAFYLPKLESHLEAQALERCLLRRGARARRAAWNIQGDHPDRDAAGGVRDGRDSLRAARPHRRAQLRPLGLHLLVHQAARQEPGLPHARPVGDGDGQGVPQRLFAPAHQDLPPPRRLCDGRHGGADPGQGRQTANEAAFAKVRADKEREATNGHDGTWVAHPDLVPIAMEVFDRLMPGKNQLAKTRDDVHVTQADLLEIHKGKRTEEGLRENIRVGVQYIEAWLRGRGAVPIYNLMEDAATAEISRAQVWQWLHLKAKLDDGREVTPEMFRDAVTGEMERVKGEVGAKAFDGGRFKEAIALFSDMSLSATFDEFLTLPAYKLID